LKLKNAEIFFFLDEDEDEDECEAPMVYLNFLRFSPTVVSDCEDCEDEAEEAEEAEEVAEVEDIKEVDDNNIEASPFGFDFFFC